MNFPSLRIIKHANAYSIRYFVCYKTGETVSVILYEFTYVACYKTVETVSVILYEFTYITYMKTCKCVQYP
jgi:hypothetical protein